MAEVRRQPNQAPAKWTGPAAGRPATPPGPRWKEIGPVRRRASVKLDSNGNGSVSFDVWSANNLWVFHSIVVNVSAAVVAVYPQVTLHVGGQPQAGLSEGASWTGNQETFEGRIEIGAADTLTVDFASGVAGTIATAIPDGTNYLWR